MHYCCNFFGFVGCFRECRVALLRLVEWLGIVVWPVVGYKGCGNVCCRGRRAVLPLPGSYSLEDALDLRAILAGPQ